MAYELTHCHQDDKEQDAEQEDHAPASERALRVFRHMGMLHSHSLHAVFLCTTSHDPQRVILQRPPHRRSRVRAPQQRRGAHFLSWVRTGPQGVTWAMFASPPKADISHDASACPLCARSGHWCRLLDLPNFLVGRDATWVGKVSGVYPQFSASGGSRRTRRLSAIPAGASSVGRSSKCFDLFVHCFFEGAFRPGRRRRLAPRVSDASVRLDENARPQSEESAGQQITSVRRLVLG